MNGGGALLHRDDEEATGEKVRRRFLVSMRTVTLCLNVLIVLACAGTLVFQGGQCLIR